MTIHQLPTVLPVGETVRRTAADRDLLIERVRGLEVSDLVAPYRVHGGPLGDFCDSLRDLVAHVLMWDEISLAVLAEAERGRAHWSLAAAWETPEVGRDLNRAGVAAGRELPVDLLVDRFADVRDALLARFAEYGDAGWTRAVDLDGVEAPTVGALAQYAMTVPGNDPYWHAAIHLGELAAVGA
jgi:hypothetical protein